MWVRTANQRAIAGIEAVLGALIARAEEHADSIMPGFTHLQTAQPVTLGHHLLAYFEMLMRDRSRFADALAGEYDGRLRVLTVSQDMQGAAVVEPFFATGGYARLEPWMDPDNELGFTLGGGVMPTTVLYDAAGEEVWRVQGDYDWSGEEARAAIDAAIAR